MAAITENQQDFAARVQRVQAMRSSAQQLVFVGADEVYTLPRREKGPKARKSRLAGPMAVLLAMPLALGLGFLSHAAGLVLRFHVPGAREALPNAEADMLAQIALGLAIAMILGHFLGWKGRVFTRFKSLGVVLGLLFCHNSIHAWPDPWSVLTSPEWVAELRATTLPHSLVWRGASFPL